MPNGERLIGRLTVLQQIDEYEFGVELQLMREGINRNRWDYRNLAQYYNTFVGKPILCAFVAGKIGDGHNMSVRYDQKGNRYYSFTDGTAERIVGTLSDSIDDFSIREIDGEKWLFAKGRLWTFYAQELVDKIVRTGSMDVSVETLVDKSHMDGEIEVFTEWKGLGVTILGDDVMPAIPNASIRALSELEDEFAQTKLKAASLRVGNNADTHTTDNLKGDNRKQMLKLLNKKAIAALRPMFGEDYHVLAAAKNDKNEILCCLMKDDGTTYRYVKPDGETTIQPERIELASANAVFAFNDEDTVEFDSIDMLDHFLTRIASLSASLDSAEKQANERKDTIDTMIERENKRRVNAAKKIAADTVEKFNANREEKIDASAANSVIADIEKGLYTDSLDANGDWDGDKHVEDAVLASCAKQVMELDKKAAAQKKHTMVWNNDAKAPAAAAEGVQGLLDRLGIQ